MGKKRNNAVAMTCLAKRLDMCASGTSAIGGCEIGPQAILVYADAEVIKTMPRRKICGSTKGLE
jgi:hypothetical protein